MAALGRLLVMIGSLVVLLGLALMLADRVPFLGRLPGDIHIKRGNFEFYFPLGTSILLSVILSLILALLKKR